ncbi:N-acetyllactosaminide beta-1,6-N-acetylglucosaminyl-transferase-like [Apostichopus japonicus]|uniref:N-acetyllactosaminide beta-1,6-N-acetylglucosaminyl-transferase-like n=1 Tax=Stichopus japonicus TaxID=307972 RepID=UPI003AB3C900
MASVSRHFYMLLLLCILFLIGQYLITIKGPRDESLLGPRAGDIQGTYGNRLRDQLILNDDKFNNSGEELAGKINKKVENIEEAVDYSSLEEMVENRNIPPFLGNMDSHFRSPYHRYWETNCSAIFKKEDAVMKATNLLIKESRVDGNVPVPSDENFFRYTQNCTAFRRIRKYPDKPYSREEKNYPVAYTITTHKEVAQVERLLRAIYQPQNIYCIHPDKKSPLAYQQAIRSLASCFDNVFIVSKIESVQYAGYTRLQADINCMADLLEKPVRWKYVMNLCGQDFPLKTNLEIIRQLKAYKGHNDINGIIPPSYIRGRTRIHHTINEKGRLIPTKKKKTPPPYNFTIYFGNAYYAASRAFVDYVINDQRAIDLLKWSEDTWSPDEHYWVTLQRYPGVPGGYPNATWDENIRFMKWADIPRHPGCIGKYVRALCVYGIGYLKYLLTQPYLFANKFYYSFDPVTLQCIEEMLDYRQHYPESIHQFVSEFPVTSLLWQNHTAYLGD